MKLCLALCTVILATAAQADVTDIDDPATVAQLRAIHQALGNASRAITVCVNDGGDRGECLCGNQDLVRMFHTAVKELVSKHPEITALNTVSFRDTDGDTISQNIPAIVRQAESPPNCSQ